MHYHDFCDVLHAYTLHMPKLSKFCNLKIHVLLYVSYSSIKLFLKDGSEAVGLMGWEKTSWEMRSINLIRKLVSHYKHSMSGFEGVGQMGS